MNERIRELWDQAAELETDDSWEGQTKFMERFAELIVSECVDIADETALGDTTYGWMVANRIKEHFGVER